MRGARLALFAISLLVGCESLNPPKVDNPVFREPPPRRSLPKRQSDGATAHADRGGAASVDDENPFDTIRTVRGIAGERTPVDPNQPEVVATVNGSPIFASEILDRYGPKMEEARRKLPPEDYRRLRRDIIKRDLEKQIDRKLLVLALRSTLKPEQSEAVDKQLDKIFEAEVARLKKEFSVNTRHELEMELNKQGTSLANLRNHLGNQEMARHYLQMKAQKGQKISREALVNYYREHQDDYAIPGAVKWQQIMISRTGPGGDDAALDKVEQVVAELQRDVDFAEVARKYSDGPTASDGGNWGDWMQAGSLADKEIEQALFELDVGVISKVFTRDDSYQLVKVTDRRQPGRVQFADAQKEIHEKLQKQDRRQTIETVIEELRKDASITTMFDQPAHASLEQTERANPFRR